MLALIFDAEVTGAQRNKGNPFDPRNRLCAVAHGMYLCNDQSFMPDPHGLYPVLNIEHDQNHPYQHLLDVFQTKINLSDMVVGFNLKFDIHWLRRYGITFRDKRVWDCQLYHFIQSKQRHRMPSMDDVAASWGEIKKLDIVKTEYWEKGLDTDQVPWHILEEYAEQDKKVNLAIFKKQWAEFQNLPDNRKKLILLQMKDLLVLQQMEYNGQFYNREKSLRMGGELEKKIQEIDSRLAKLILGEPINFNSDEQVSYFLYGGKIITKVREEYLFSYKDPKKAPIKKEHWIEKERTLPRIFNPLERTEKQKEGVYSTDKTTLLKLKKGASRFQMSIIDTLLERSKIEKRKSTYCFGTVKLLDENCWENQTLHGQFHQCVAVTGRLSSSKPNLQNQDEQMQVCFESRFKWNN